MIGSGPAGAYAAEALVRLGDATVDVLDRLPAPFGLVRHGVAPDHPKTQSIRTALAEIYRLPGINFVGNVAVGEDVTLDELRATYDAVVVAFGAAVDRRMGVPGEDLPGSASATDFVAWYTGHPDIPPQRFELDARTVVVVGAGNVAGDVARMLARTAEELRDTDVPPEVLAAFARSQVRDIHLVARRGPAQARFTTRELRELGELTDADVLVDPADLELDPVSEQAVADQPASRRNLDVLRGWARQAPAGRPRRVHLTFFRRPVAVLGTQRVTGIRLERTRLDGGGELVATGDLSDLPAELVFRAVGYRSLPLPGLPFDERAGVVPHLDGRVLTPGGPEPGLYVAGWAKRGPTGVIGTNKHDARETVRALLADLASRAPFPDVGGVLPLLARRGVRVVTWEGWLAIEAAEAAAGEVQGRRRATISDRAELLRIAGAG